MQFSSFQWDAGNWPKCGAHGLTKQEIEAVFHAGPGIAPDLKHSASEIRQIAVGRASNGRPVFIAFVLRRIDGMILVRPVSARYMHAKEAKRYETQSSNS
jgi:uncharacterized DUF497 family protein